MKLSAQTEGWILSIAPPHVRSMKSPQTFEDVKEYFDKNGKYHVFEGGAKLDETVFNTWEARWAYRAWHDSIHVQFDIPFEKKNELAVARIQESIALDYGISKRDAKILRLDLEAHIHYYYTTGEHPERQVRLIADCMNESLNGVMLKVAAGERVYHDMPLDANKIEAAIMNGQSYYAGHALPIGQQSGTYSQKRTYAYLKALEFIYKVHELNQEGES